MSVAKMRECVCEHGAELTEIGPSQALRLNEFRRLRREDSADTGRSVGLNAELVNQDRAKDYGTRRTTTTSMNDRTKIAQIPRRESSIICA